MYTKNNILIDLSINSANSCISPAAILQYGLRDHQILPHLGEGSVEHPGGNAKYLQPPQLRNSDVGRHEQPGRNREHHLRSTTSGAISTLGTPESDEQTSGTCIEQQRLTRIAGTTHGLREAEQPGSRHAPIFVE
jgi:hypothetical protein